MSKLTLLECNTDWELEHLPWLLLGCSTDAAGKMRPYILNDRRFLDITSPTGDEGNGLGDPKRYQHNLDRIQNQKARQRLRKWGEDRILSWEAQVRAERILPMLDRSQEWLERISTTLMHPQIQTVGILIAINSSAIDLHEHVPVTKMDVATIRAEELLMMKENVLYRFDAASHSF